MALQIRRGTNAQRTFIPVVGEPLFCTDTSALFIGDGVTTGGVSPTCTPSGAAGGDLQNTYPNPTVHKIHGNNVQSGTPSNNDMLVWETSNSRWARKHPVLTSTSTYLTADLAFASVNTWFDVTSLSLAAGTWLLNGNTTNYGNSDYNVGHIRLFDGTNVLASSSFYGIIDFTTSAQVAATVTLASTTTVKLQCYPTDINMGCMWRVIPGTAKATGLVAVRLA